MDKAKQNGMQGHVTDALVIDEAHTTARSCGHCHECGAELIATGILEWCNTCGQWKAYKAHGHPEGTGGDCPSPKTEIKDKASDGE